MTITADTLTAAPAPNPFSAGVGEALADAATQPLVVMEARATAYVDYADTPDQHAYADGYATAVASLHIEQVNLRIDWSRGTRR